MTNTEEARKQEKREMERKREDAMIRRKENQKKSLGFMFVYLIMILSLFLKLFILN